MQDLLLTTIDLMKYHSDNEGHTGTEKKNCVIHDVVKLFPSLSVDDQVFLDAFIDVICHLSKNKTFLDGLNRTTSHCLSWCGNK